MKTKQLIQEMNQYSEQLSEENKALFDEILLKIRFSNISEHEAEEFSHHCLNLLLQAEQENLEVCEVLGTEDLDLFCKEYIKEVRSSYGVLKKIMIQIKYLPLILLIFVGGWEMFVGVLLPTWVKEKKLSLDIPVSIAMIVDTLFATFIIWISLHYASKISWDLNHAGKKADHKWTLVILLTYFLATGFFVLSKLFLTPVLFHVNFLVFIIICCVLYFIESHIENKLS